MAAIRHLGFSKIRLLNTGTPWVKRDWSSSRPQKAHLGPKPHLHANFGTDRSIGATWARAEGIKKKKKKGEERNLQWQTGCSHRPPTLTQRYVFCMPGGLREVVSYKFQVSSKSVERVSRCGGRKLPFPILRPVAYIII